MVGIQKIKYLAMVVHALNPSTCEAKAFISL